MDRGAWGVETLTLLLAYKWLLPRHFFMIRGNHEGAFATQVYGKGVTDCGDHGFLRNTTRHSRLKGCWPSLQPLITSCTCHFA